MNKKEIDEWNQKLWCKQPYKSRVRLAPFEREYIKGKTWFYVETKDTNSDHWHGGLAGNEEYLLLNEQSIEWALKNAGLR